MNEARGKTIYLRMLGRSDLVRTHEWLHRSDIAEKIGVRVPFSQEEQLEWFEQLKTDSTKIVFAICRLNDDVHIGNVSLDLIDRRHRNARLCIFVADQSMRGEGVGSEAIELLLEYAFDRLSMHKVWCKTNSDDRRVVGFYQKLGFIQEGVWREHEIINGKFHDKILFAKFSDKEAGANKTP